jgi:ferritin-like metal-binding protein YciE
MKTTITKAAQKGNQKKNKKDFEKAKQGLRDLFTGELKNIYWAEKALTKAIPKMIKNAADGELIEVLNAHLILTKEHVIRLEEVFYLIDEKSEDIKCEAVEVLISNAEQIMKKIKEETVRDEAIISAALKIEHYEIATYGTLCSFANTLGENAASALLHATLNEEKEADAKLSQIGELMELESVDADDVPDTFILIETKLK